ncbi:S24 family peptidase [Arcobacter sp. CECT 8985]|uniref:S24 family peptidase n=1 Tax=Arcobacter sp. CECT 8985 TaxID=1935424 RepID=UPI00100A437E|nr:S24 family peptidase [Arcobacter sp. CECT 8985]RXJ88205.1 peptidase [Arcobacter sp. CECT 8985]
MNENIITLEYVDVFDNDKQKNISFSKDLVNHNCIKSLFALLVDGESMQPLIKDKSVVIADLSKKQLEDDSIYIIYFENKMWIKKAKFSNDEFNFISINDNFKHLVYKQKDVHVVAKVVLTFTKL